MTKTNSNLHRAAALLAALCLLASMALPVYAAETETDFSVSNSETIPSDDNAEHDADETGSDISVSNLETSQKDADTTNAGSKTEPEISVPNSEAITNSADTTDKAAGAPLTEGVTGSENTAPADSAAADKTADTDNTGEDSTGGEDEAGFLNEGDSADDRMLTAGNAKESDIALCADDTAVPQGTKYTFYFAPPQDWVDLLSDKAITCSFMRGNTNDNPPSPKHEVRTTTATLITDKTTDNRPIYQVDVYHNNDDANSLCPYGGFVWVRFTLDENHWVTMKGKREGENSNNYWMEVGKIANKCLDGNQLTGNTENVYDYDIDKWVPYADITPKHVRYCGERMTLLNKSAQALDNVTVTFWEKDADGNLTQVGSQQVIQSLQPNDKSEDITIPETACAYVSFQKADGTYIGKQYFNFYNDEDPSDNIAVFPYDPDTRYCLIYTGDKDVRWSAPNSKTVYFDATFSDMSYKNDAAKIPYGMPDANGNLWCYMTSDESGKEPITKLQMARDGTSEIWYVEVPQGYTKIRFASWAVDNETAAQNGDGTAMLTIPKDKDKPCFYADTSDDVIYQGGDRDGYWDELGKIRDAEKGKKAADESAKSIVDLESKAFTPQSNTKYISTTLYDYYTDYELNGNNRNTYRTNEKGTHRSNVPFRQFDRALSNYYSSSTDASKIQNPIYTGHFQPDYSDWGCRFSAIAANLNLYGWGNSSEADNSAYRHFMAVNNSTIDVDGKGTFYNATFQGLVGNQMVNGMPVMAGTNLAEPHFNEAFLTGTNTEKAVLGKVYKDVSFPFTQKAVFTENNGDTESKAKYWYFDSNERSLYLKQDTAKSKYYLEATKTGEYENGEPKYTDDKSENVDSEKGKKGTYGFFPFNQNTIAATASNYNYGFGAKLQFDFTLTDDGKVVVGTDESGKDIKVPIKFFFSGDDDVWVYIDGQLVLDVGGAHGKASGLLEFDETENKDANTVIPYVSSNKAGGDVYTDPANKTVYFNGKEVKFEKKGKILDKNGDEFTLDKGTTHTLTMFYMERGMWESNMAVAFNFPDHNELQVEKQVDLSGVDEAFQDCFNDQKIFDFTIQNLATHYGTKEAVRPGTGNVDRKVVDLTKDVKNIQPATKNSTDYIFELADNPAQGSGSDTGQVLHWFALYNDLSSTSRDMRYGILELNKPIDLNQYGYLTFEIYVKGETNLSLNNLYLQLLDDGNRQMGSLSKAGLNGATFGSVTLEPNKWNTVKLSLNKMKEVVGFDNKVTTIRVGDNYQRHIYFRNFTFVPKTVPDIKTGFTTEQDKIPDYGSAASGTLKNATYAKYTSNFDGMQVVDDQGRFVLENGETITFDDQFRRGSYISLKEILNTKLYDTTWTVYENGLPVTSMTNAGGNTVTVAEPSKSLEKQPTSGPDDGRTEKVGADAEKKDNNYSGTKPTDANTIVFRSYSNPDESGDSLTSLKVQYINKVKTGGLIIKKEVENDNLTGTYEFKVTFSDVGGQGLETSDPIVKTYPINMSDAENPNHTVIITGIPVDTRYTIEELEPKDGSHLQGITLEGNEKNAHVVKNTTVEGVIVESKTPQMTATFTNTSRKLIDIEFTKLWQDADGKPLGSAKQPSEIYIQLQRRLENSSEKDPWEAVTYPATGSANYVTVTSINDRWKYSFKGLDQRPAGGTTNYVYRIVEGTRGTDGNFKAAGSSITIGGNTYTISPEAKLTGATASGTSETITGGSGEIVLTNTLQDPEFTLNIVKKGVTTGENGSETQTPLSGVEFKLERLTESSEGGKPQVDTTYEFGSGNIGSITGITGEGGTIAINPFTNLKAGSYQLTEVKTAEGYNLLSKPIQIQFTTNGECYIDGVRDTMNVVSSGNTCTMTLTVLNRKSFELPHTGADAPSLWLLIGLPALVAVLLVLVFRYNKKGGRRQ